MKKTGCILSHNENYVHSIKKDLTKTVEEGRRLNRIWKRRSHRYKMYLWNSGLGTDENKENRYETVGNVEKDSSENMNEMYKT